MRFPLIAVTLAALLAGCGQPSNQGQQPSPSPSSSSSASPAASTAPPVAQQVIGSPIPTSSPGSLPAATPATATVAPGATLPPSAVVPAAPPAEDAPPQIVDLHLDKTVFQSGEVVSGTVHTSLNTASVEARIGGYGISVPKVGAGRFALKYTVPDLPFFLKRTYDMVVIARNTAGVKTERVVPITIH